MKRTFNAEIVANNLKKMPLLKAVPPVELVELARKSKFVDVEKGDVVFRKDDPSSYVYFVYKGQIAEFVSYNASVEVIVKLRERYDFIGEMGVFSGENYMNTAVALESTALLAVSAGDFLALVRKNTSAMEFIIRELIMRLSNSCHKMINTMYINAEGKLAFTIINLMSGTGDGSTGYVNINQTELAASAGIRRQTAARILGEWRIKGIIKTARGKIYPKDIDALLEILIDSELEGA